MEATILDMKYKTKSILGALERNERVEISYRGVKKAIISPIQKEAKKEVVKHPFFGMNKDEMGVDEVMESLRGNRF